MYISIVCGPKVVDHIVLIRQLHGSSVHVQVVWLVQFRSRTVRELQSMSSLSTRIGTGLLHAREPKFTRLSMHCLEGH